MSTDLDTTRIVRSWLEEGVTRLPDRVLDDVFDRLPATRQRRATAWPARRLFDMNKTLTFVVAAATIAIVAFLGIRLFGGPADNLGDTAQTPTPILTATPAALPSEAGPLDPGTYTAHPFAPPNDSIGVTFTVPEGWEPAPPPGVSHATAGFAGPSGASLTFWLVTGLYSDPCDADYYGTPDVVVGPTVDDLASAFAEQTAYEATTPVDVTLGGYSGKRVDLQLPSDESADDALNQADRFGALCRYGGYFLWDGSIYAQGPDNRWHLWILDVDGVRLVVLAEDFPGTSEEHQAELQGIVDSIRIEP
jgi:hypothetical protein